MEVFPYGLATAARVFTKLLAPIVAHLHLQGCLMFPYIDNIFHAQVSLSQECRSHDLSHGCHFKLEFVMNLLKSALVPVQVMLHMGGLSGMARGVVLPSQLRFTHGPGVAQFHPGDCSWLSLGKRVGLVTP